MDDSLTHPRYSLSAWQRYGLGLVCVGFAVALRMTLLQSLGSQFMFAVFYPAVMLTAWYGGGGPGIFAVLIGASMAPHIGAPPRTFHWLTHREWLGIMLFSINGSTMSLIIERLHWARHRLLQHQRDLEAQVEERTAELARAHDLLTAEMLEREKTAALMMAAAKELRDVKAAVNDRAIVAEIDHRGVIVSVNDNFCRLSRYERSELIGQDYRTIHWEQVTGEEPDPMWGILATGGVWNGDVKMRAKDGTPFWVDATLFSSGEDNRPKDKYVVIWVDITDRKAAEKAVQRSEARYRAIGETLDFGVWMCSPDGHNTYVSDTLLNLIGVTQEEFSGFGWQHVIHPDDAPGMLVAWKECVRTGGGWEREFRVRGVDGLWYTILGRGGPVRDDDGNLCGWAGINVDITKLKRTEEALRESEARYRAIGESLDYGVWLCEPDGRNTYASDSFLNLVGITQEQCSNFGWGEVLHPDDAEGAMAAWKECIRTETLWDREHRFKGLDGQWHHILARGLPVRDESGKVTGWAGINLDIGKLKATELALHESEAYVRNVLDSLFAFVGVLKPDGTLVETNRAVLEISGIGPEDIAGLKFWDCMWWTYSAEVQQRIRFAVERAAEGEASRFDVRVAVAEGRFIHVDFTLAPMRDSEGRVAYLIPSGVDITERKRAEQLIRDLNAELEDRVKRRTQELHQANEELRHQFAARRRFEEEILTVTKREQQRIGQDLHDDLGQQLAGLWCLMRVVENNLKGQQSPEAANAARISELLEKSLATTRSLARGLLPVTPEPYGLMSALQALAGRISEMFGINCQFDCPEPVSVEDNVRATHLYRIAQESISNAARHGRAKNVNVELVTDEQNIVLTIWNDGRPLAVPENNATGMGLRIMRYRAGIIGGTLKIEDQEGGGVGVTCTMPRSAPDITSGFSHAVHIAS